MCKYNLTNENYFRRFFLIRSNFRITPLTKISNPWFIVDEDMLSDLSDSVDKVLTMPVVVVIVVDDDIDDDEDEVEEDEDD